MLSGWFDTVKTFLSEHVLLAVAIVLFVEELGVPLLVPGDILMMLAGIEVARGTASLPTVLAVELGVTMIAATILFYLSRGIGRSALMRFGHYIGMDHERIAYAEERLSRYQFRAVVLGRLTPGLRVIIVIAAGLANLESRRFLPALLTGAFLYLLAYTLLGMFAGEAAIHFVERLAIPASAVVSIIALGFLALGMHGARNSKLLAQPLRPTLFSAAAAGIVAAIAALLTSDIVRGFLVVGARLVNEAPAAAAPVNAGRLVGPLLSWPGFILIALVLALIVPALGVRRPTLPVRLVLTALLPFVLTMVVVNPALAGRGLGWSTGISLTSLIVVGVRWAAFAVTLEYLDELMYGERPARPPQAADGAPLPAPSPE